MKPEKQTDHPVKIAKARFGAFEVDFSQREIRKHGLRLHLQPKPFLILEMLLERPGELVTREEIARRLWPHAQVSVDHSLNTALNSLRQILNDSLQRSHVIETRSGLGYIFVAPVERIPPKATSAPPATAQDYLTGRYLLDKMTEQDAAKSIAYFESALLQDSGSAFAYSGLADTWCEFARLAIAPTPKAAEKARNYAVSALSSNSEIAEPHIAMARVKLLFDGDLKGAETEYLRALGINPNCAPAHSGYAALLHRRHQSEQAFHHLSVALQLEPLSCIIQTEKAWLLYSHSNHDAAAACCWQILAVEGSLWPAQIILALAHHQLDAQEEAITEAANAVECSHRHPAALAVFAYLNSAEAQNVAAELHAQSKRRHVPPASLALAHLAARDMSSAAMWMNLALQDRDCLLHWLFPIPAFKSLSFPNALPSFAANQAASA